MKTLLKQCAWCALLLTCAFVAGHVFASPGIPAWLYVGSVFYVSPNTGDSLAALDPSEVHKIWQKGVDVFEHADFSETAG